MAKASLLWHWRARMWGPWWFRRAMQAYDWWRSGEPMITMRDVEYIVQQERKPGSA